MAHFVVVLGGDLSEEELDLALETAPDHVDAGPGYPALLDEAGFIGVEVVDVSEEYLATVEAWAEAWEAEAEDLTSLFGSDEVTDSIARR